MMEISSLQRKVEAGDLPLDRLASNSNISEAEKVAELSRQFEAVLLRQILQEAQKPVFKSEFVNTSAVSSIYQDVIVNQMADSISQSNALGLAKSLQGGMTSQLLEEKSGEAEKAATKP